MQWIRIKQCIRLHKCLCALIFFFLIIETELQTDIDHTIFEAQYSLLNTHTLIKTIGKRTEALCKLHTILHHWFPLSFQFQHFSNKCHHLLWMPQEVNYSNKFRNQLMDIFTIFLHHFHSWMMNSTGACDRFLESILCNN